MFLSETKLRKYYLVTMFYENVLNTNDFSKKFIVD